MSGAFVTSQFRILYSYLCSALYRSRFSRGAQLGTFVFHYWGRGCSFLRLRGGLLWSIVGITANREWNVNMADKREGKQNLIVPSPIWYGILPQHRKLYPALSPRRRRMTEFSKLNSVSTLANDLRRERTKPYWNAHGLAQTPPLSIPS